LIVANHQSTLDVPFVGSLVGVFPHLWLAKKEVFEWPVFRFVAFRLAVPIDISSLQKAMRSLLKSVQVLNRYKAHGIIFPEGARYTDGNIHDFYGGFAILARRTERPVIPVRIFNLNRVYPPGSFIVHSHPVRMVIGKPMTIQEGESDEAFKDRVRQWFLEQR